MWHSYYLFRPRPHERFLVDELKPFVDSIPHDAFFFIRYNVPADHIRLRLKSGDDLDARVLQAFPDAQIVEYVPEVERYVKMDIAERQFELSSRAVLEAMSRPGWSYELALSVAMRMHLDLAEAFALDARSFFGRTTKRFLRVPGAPRDPEAEARRIAEFDARQLEPSPRDAGWLEAMREIARDFGNTELNALQSFVHMTNNRLGIRYFDEAFIARKLKLRVRSLT
jgi:thiopeptide-type bacteriocin biosynthesis protein